MPRENCPTGTVPENAIAGDLLRCYAYLIKENPLWRANLPGYDRAGNRRRDTFASATGTTVPPVTWIEPRTASPVPAQLVAPVMRTPMQVTQHASDRAQIIGVG